MAFPFIFHSNFETGDNTEWDSQTDTATPDQMTFPHYSALTRTNQSELTPYSGAYCARIQLTGGTADAVLVEGDIDIAASANNFIAFDVLFSKDFAATADDTAFLLELNPAAAMVVMGFKITAATGAIQLGIGKAAPTTFGNVIQKGVWYTVELDISIDTTANDGTIDIYLTRAGDPVATGVYAAQVGSLTQVGVTTGSLGTSGVLATTTGTILIDNFIQDDARIYPRKRFQEESIRMRKDGQAFIGACTLDATSITDTTQDAILNLYDTDDFADKSIIGNHESVVFVSNAAADDQSPGFNTPVEFFKGIYVQMSGAGTEKQSFVSICKPSAIVMSNAGYRDLGRGR